MLRKNPNLTSSLNMAQHKATSEASVYKEHSKRPSHTENLQHIQILHENDWLIHLKY